MLRDIRETAPPLASTIEIAKRSQAAGSPWLFKSSPDAVDLEWTAPADAAYPKILAQELEQPSTAPGAAHAP